MSGAAVNPKTEPRTSDPASKIVPFSAPIARPLGGLKAAIGLSNPPAGAQVFIFATAGDDSGVVAQLLARFRNQQVHVVSEQAEPEWGLDGHASAAFLSASNLSQMNWHLKRFGPVEVIVDVTTDPALSHRDTWRRCYFHLRNRGVYLVRLAAREKNGRSLDADFVSLLGQVAAARSGAGMGAIATDDRAMAMATHRVLLGSELVALVKRGDHLLKMRHAELDRLLPTRSTDATAQLIATVPGGTHRSLATVTSHRHTRLRVGFPEQYNYPELRLREYTGRIAMATHSLLLCDGTVLPESFRHHLALRMVNPQTTDVSPEFAQVPESMRPTSRLPGRYFHLDSPFTGHFGHVMTETISRLWAWDRAKQRDPDLKALLRTRFPNDREPVLEKTLLGAYGIADEDIVFSDHPVFVESIIGVTPMFHNHQPHYAHPGLSEVYERLRSIAISPARPASHIFVSRGGGFSNRACRNLPEVEEVFVSQGFTLVYPETMSLAEQAGLFGQAEVIAGFAGSAMFNILFCRKLRAMVLLTHESYDARNEYLIASVIGADLHYFWSAPDLVHPDEGWSQTAFDSAWQFDFDRNGAELDQLLGQLR